MKNINMDLVRVTEAAAISASAWIGSGNKLAADKDATEGMRDRLNRMDIKAVIRIGEGKKDQSFGLFQDEKIGRFWKEPDPAGSPQYDVAVDPIDGTTPTVSSGPEAMSVMALGTENSMFCTDEYYMHKLACGPEIASKVRLNIEDDLEKILRSVASATGKPMQKIMVCILNRPRHDPYIQQMRALGVRIKLIQDCDISGAIATCRPESGIDLQYGAGGAPECVLTASAMKCLKGDFQARLADKNGKPYGRVYHIEDLIQGPCVFVATGITNGSLLRGVRFTERGPVTNSVFMRSQSGTVRWLTTEHGNKPA